MKTKKAAILWALFLWWVWAHKFYLNQTGKWVLYLLFFWTFIPAIFAFIDIIRYLWYSDDEWNDEFNNKVITNTKKCYYCWETIKENAIKCKHCQSDLWSIVKNETVNKYDTKLANENFVWTSKKENSSAKENKEKSDRSSKIFLIYFLWGSATLLSLTKIISNSFSTFYLLCSFWIIISIWLHPRIWENVFINRFKGIPQYKLRIFFSILVFIFIVMPIMINWLYFTVQKASPKPVITILSNTDNQKGSTWYVLEFKVENEISVDVQGKPMTESWGIYKTEIQLFHPLTEINIVAHSWLNSETKTISITRDKTVEEIASEQNQKKKREVERLRIAREQEQMKKNEEKAIKEKELQKTNLKSKYEKVVKNWYMYEIESRLLDYWFKQIKSWFEKAPDWSTQVAQYYEKQELWFTVTIMIQSSYALWRYYTSVTVE